MPWSVTLMTLAFVSAVVKDDAYLQQTSDVTPPPVARQRRPAAVQALPPRGRSSASPSCPESKSTPSPSTRASRSAIWQRSTVCPCTAASPATTSPPSCASPSAVRSRQPCCTGLKWQCGGYRMGPIRWARSHCAARRACGAVISDSAISPAAYNSDSNENNSRPEVCTATEMNEMKKQFEQQ
ncbi:hypothetical protein PR003_g33819, partial [Phytophthora rubi]